MAEAHLPGKGIGLVSSIIRKAACCNKGEQVMFEKSRSMVTSRRVTTAVLATGIISLALGVAAPSAFAKTPPTNIGQTNENYLCSPADQWIQTATASGTSYVVPAGDKKLKKWSTNGGADAGTMQFEVWAPVGGINYKLVYISAQTTLQAGKVKTVTLNPALKVVAGDVIGYRAVTGANCALDTDNVGDTYVYDPSSSPPTVGSTVDFSGPASGFEFNIAAVVK
jgi:hypothetical protein